jgi:hypothetical protein
MLPAAFGDAYERQSPQTVVFDAYGRDFAFPLSRLMTRPQPSVLRHWQEQAEAQTTTHEDKGWQFQLTRRAGSADWSAARLAVNGGGLDRFMWQQATGRHFQTQDDSTPLLSLQGHPSLLAYGKLNQFAWHRQVGRHAMEWHTTLGANDQTKASGHGPRAQRHEVWWHGQRDGPMAWSLGYTSTGENGGLMGHAGSGALGVDRSATQALAVQWERPSHGGWRTFARAEFGKMQVAGQTEYLRIDRASTSLWHAGTQWADEKRLLALSVSQPLRVDRAQALLNLPTGRTTDGTVIRQTRPLLLRPSGREMRWELAYRQSRGLMGTDHGLWGLNLLHTHDAGHVAGQNDWAAFGSYQRRW